jgi:hypothetical protein
MKSKEISGIAAIAIASSSLILLLGPVLLIPVSGSPGIAPATPQAGAVYTQPQLQTLSSGQSMVITGTFKIESSVVLSTNITDGIATTVSKAVVARNDSTSPGVVTGIIKVVSVSRVDAKTGNGTAFAVGTFSGTIAGFGPGVCTYRNNTTLTAQGTPRASSQSTHWITGCTGALSGISEVTTTIGRAGFTAIVTFDSPTTPPTPASALHNIVPYL